MMAVYQRMGAVRNGELVRLVHLLKTNRAIEQRVSSPTLAKSLSVAGNTVLAARAALTKRDKSVELSVRKTGLDVSPNMGYGLEEGVTLCRTSDYLNWRYLENPSGAVSILSVTGGGEGSIAYRITEDDDDVEIVDMFGTGDTRALRELVLTVVDEARERGATSVTTALSEEHPWMEVLGELGF